MTNNASEIFLIDGFSLLFRAYYAVPSLLKSDDQPVGALYGFVVSLLKIVEEEKARQLYVTLDSPGPGLRHDLDVQYKANRAEAPEDLIAQIEQLPALLQTLGIPSVSCARYEADDIIAAFTKQARAKGHDVVIVSADKDLLQLVDEHVCVYSPGKGVRMGVESVREKFGVAPAQMHEYLMLVGDTADNIPGAKGIGPKTATKLLESYHNIDGIYQNMEHLKPGQQRSLEAFRQERAKTHDLIRLYDDVPVTLEMDQLWRGSTQAAVDKVVEQYEFHSLRGRIVGLVLDGEEATVAVPSSDVRELDLAALQQAVELSGYVCCVQQYVCGGEGAVYTVSDTQEAPLRTLCQREDVRCVVWREVPEREDGCTECLATLLFLAYGCVRMSDAVGVPELARLVGGPAWDMATACAHMLAIYNKCMKRLFAHKLIAWAQTIERPLVGVLHDMSARGVCVNVPHLRVSQEQLESHLAALQKKIFEQVGHELNLASSQQLAVVLYDEMKILPAKASRSTDALVLRAVEDHPLVRDILSWRHVHKLLSTYIKPLQKWAEEGVVHTQFFSTATLTGRLSSQQPNMQNIPAKTELGRSLRKCFEAREGHVFLAFDYSQIELRLLAHHAGDGRLRQGFFAQTDVHRQTAALMYGIESSNVTKQQRTAAKVINFGVVYGMGVSVLARRLNVDRAEAQELLDKFWAQYPEVMRYQEEMQAYAQKTGYVKTFSGRCCFLPGVQSSSRGEKAHALRQAINAPLQGGNADIMKKLMVQLHPKLCGTAHMLLQVHDELLLEVPEAHVDQVREVVVREMCEVVSLQVPLEVNVLRGDNWGELFEL